MIEKNEPEIMKNWTHVEVPLLSVVVLTFNQENYISQTLDSILMQETDFPFEIIVHDDCSMDDTVKILNEYAQKYPNIIKLILQKENQWSQGINPTVAPCNEAVGKYIAFCEGDDYWTDPSKLQIQLDEMRKVKDCQMSFHPAVDKWEDNYKKDSITTKQANGNKLFTASEVVLGGGGFCPTASLVFEKEALENLPEWFHKAASGDYFLQIFGSLKGGALYIDRPMSVYRRNAIGSWSSAILDIKKKEKEFQKILEIFNEMDRYFNQRFHSEIIKIESDLYLELALDYLISNNILQFKQNINTGYYLAKKKSKKLLLSYHLRNLPIVLRGIIKLYKNINKYLASKG